MICRPKFSYFLADAKYPIRPNCSEWTSALPISRITMESKSTGRSFTYGDYFNAVRVFLERNQYKAVATALSRVGRGNGDVEQILAIRVFLVKHGQYYHPARIEIECKNNISFFVLNAALSATAREMIKEEVSVLGLMGSRFPYSFIPEVYAAGEVRIDDGRDLDMFLGQWFEDYHEFHLSRSSKGQNRIIVWDGNPAKCYLSQEQTGAVYETAALILTAYYNIATFEHIAAWHHAAGDFVIKPAGDRIAMKLITVRQYAPLLENVKPDVNLILQALQLFLVKISLQMGLDRLDGVGDPVWAGEIAVSGAVNGFFKGLMMQVKAGLIPVEIVEGCREYLAAVPGSEWIDMLVSVVNRYDPCLPYLSLIRRNLDQHADCLYKKMAAPDQYTI